MGVTIRIQVPDTAALDGSTPLPADAKARLFSNKTLGLNQIDLLPGERFGEFDPGELAILGQPASSYVLRHLSVVSLAALTHDDDSYVAVRSPPRPGGGSGLRIIQPLGPTLDTVGQGTGIITEGNRIPIPTGHKLIFNTIADGAVPGPHIIQITLDPARISDVPPARPTGPPGLVPTVPLPPLPAQLAAGAVSPAAITFGSLPNPRTVTVSGVGFLTGPDDIVRFIRTSQNPTGPAELPFTPTIPGTTTDIVGTVPTDTIKGTFKLRVSRAADPGIYNEIDGALVIT
jgi:hypothetical protein